MNWTERDKLAVATLRGLALDMPAAAASGHSGTAMALAPLGWLLYSRVLRHDPSDPAWPDRDRLVLSNGHACVLLYGLLHLCGYALTLEDLRAFRKPGSRTPGHPESWVTPGVDASTGPLGQGLGMAVGMALAERFLAAHFGDLVEHYTYVLCSDGDLMEGVSAEASSLAGHQRLGKLIVFYDDNRVTIDGSTDLSWSESVADRYRAYGWHVVEGCDGEDAEGLAEAIAAAQEEARPSLICVRTVIGFPSPGMQGRHEAHSPPFSAEEIWNTKEVLGLDPGRSFQVPQGLFTPRRPAEGWYERLRRSGRAEEWRQWHERPRPGRLEFTRPMATRVAGGEVLRATDAPNLMGGSADLAGSTCAWLEGSGHLRFGVREHAMAALCNGMAQHGGVVPFGSTYFIFSDYMKPALRLAALSRLPVVYLWTHDSLALGEDGPTHQPVEQLATLRALPNFWVFRPADANETAAAWQLALARPDGPSGLVLSRQTLPLLPPGGAVMQGAYVLEDSPEPQVTLLASGAEVHLCLEARLDLEIRGVATRVVSMPCWELFEALPETLQRAILGPPVRVAVEAGASLGWHRWVGDRGAVLGLDRFGASGPGAQLMRDYGFTREAVVETALRLLA